MIWWLRRSGRSAAGKKYRNLAEWSSAVDGFNPANSPVEAGSLFVYPVYPIIYKVYAFQVVQDFFHQQYDLISKDSNKYRGIHGHSAKEDNLETIGNHWKSTDHIGVEPFMRFQSCQKPTRVQSPICCNIRINIIIIHNAVCLRTYKFQKKGHVHAIFARTDRQNVEDFNSRILSRKCKHGEFMCFFFSNGSRTADWDLWHL